jgi:hypothetical protein
MNIYKNPLIFMKYARHIQQNPFNLTSEAEYMSMLVFLN